MRIYILSEMSMDGKITSGSNSSSKFFGNYLSEKEMMYIHKKRHNAQAIIVGKKTIDTDNPYLTDRYFGNEKLIRIIPSNSLDFDYSSHIFQDNKKTLIVTSKKNINNPKVDEIKKHGKKVEFIGETKVDFKGLKDYLENKLGLQEVIVEGGGTINSKLLEADVNFAALKGAFFGCEMYERGTRRSNDIDLLVYEEDLGKLDTCLREMGYIQSNMPNGELVEATKKEKIIQRMNYHDLVPYVKKTDVGIMELDINFLFDGNKNLIDKTVYEMGTKVYNGGYRITGLNPYTNMAFLCCHFYREATDTIWTEGRRDVTLYKIVDMMNFIRFYREQLKYDELMEVFKKLNIEKKAYFTFKIMTEFYEDDFLSEMLKRLDDYKNSDDEMNVIHDTKNKTTIYRDETFFEKTFARG